MSGVAGLHTLVCCALIGCSPSLHSELARHAPAANTTLAEGADGAAMTSGPTATRAPAVPAPGVPAPDVLAVPASAMPASATTPQSMRLVAVTDAPDFALRPRIEGDDQVIVPLPPERAHLVKVEVGLLVTRRDSGEIMDQQMKIFNWKTSGAALRFYLPSLPAGEYVAAIRTTSTVRTSSGETVQEIKLPDQAQISFRSEDYSRPTDERTHAVREFRYHFEPHHTRKDKPKLVPDEGDMLDKTTQDLAGLLRNEGVTKVTLDCWASSDGDANYNMRVSLKRCEWIHTHLLNGALHRRAGVQLIEASHGEDNPPEPEPVGITGDELKRIQALNRVVILKIYTSE